MTRARRASRINIEIAAWKGGRDGGQRRKRSDDKEKNVSRRRGNRLLSRSESVTCSSEDVLGGRSGVRCETRSSGNGYSKGRLLFWAVATLCTRDWEAWRFASPRFPADMRDVTGTIGRVAIPRGVQCEPNFA